MRSKLVIVTVALAITAFWTSSRAAENSDLHSSGERASETSLQEIPQSLFIEHEHLHQELVALVKKPDPIGSSAKKLAVVLDPHFEKENAQALPLLGLLASLGRGEVNETMRPAIEASRSLKSAMKDMLAEHKVISGALSDLQNAGEKAGDRDATKFAEELSLHAQTEEAVLYPAAILVGAYVETQLRSSPPKK